MQILFYTEAEYIVFSVENNLMNEIFDFGLCSDPADIDDAAIAGELYNALLEEADYIEGDTEMIMPAFTSFLNGARKAPPNSISDTGCAFTENDNFLVYGEIANMFSINTIDKTLFEEQVKVYNQFDSRTTVKGVVGRA